MGIAKTGLLVASFILLVFGFANISKAGPLSCILDCIHDCSVSCSGYSDPNQAMAYFNGCNYACQKYKCDVGGVGSG